MVTKMDCLFCKIANKEISGRILFENKYVMAILDAFPEVDGHTLIIPKEHFENVYTLPNHLLIQTNRVAKKMTKVLMQKLEVNSISWVVNFGDAQKIKHYHLHLLPDFKHNKGKTPIVRIYDKIMKD